VRYGSVCSGIEAATVAWHPIGWTPAFFSEIEKFPRAVLAHHYADTPCHGDFTTIGAYEYGPIDLLVGGTPCQSFSIAGLRGGLADDRGNLALEYLRLAQRTRPQWLVWENVPGVLSSNGGRDFGSILGGMVELGYGIAYRVLDAQYFGIPQRRRRVFVVGCLGDWRRAAAVLFERHSLSGHPAPRREKGQVAPTVPSRGSAGGGLGTDFDCDGGLTVMAHGQGGAEITTGKAPTLSCNHEAPILAHSLRAEGFDASEDGTGRGTPLVPVAIQERATSENEAAGPDGKGFRTDGMAYTLEARATVQAVAFGLATQQEPKWAEELCPTLQVPSRCGGGQPDAVAFDMRGRDGGAQFEGPHDTANIRAASGGSSRSYVASSAVRRLTPMECERLQGFPDGYTQIPWRGKDADQCPDGPRYKALGNSMAVPVMNWIGRRIEQVNQKEPT